MLPVLHIEDEPDDIFLTGYAWERAGLSHPLIVLRDGQQAIDYLAGRGPFADRQRHPLPCLLLLDWKLPLKSGAEVLRWLRQQPAVQALNVVVLSGSDQESDIATARSLGVLDYIVKPSDPSHLVEIFRERKQSWFPRDGS